MHVHPTSTSQRIYCSRQSYTQTYISCLNLRLQAVSGSVKEVDSFDLSRGKVDSRILIGTERLFERLGFFLRKRGWKFSELFTRFDVSREGQVPVRVIEEGLNVLLRGRTPEGFLFQVSSACVCMRACPHLCVRMLLRPMSKDLCPRFKPSDTIIGTDHRQRGRVPSKK